MGGEATPPTTQQHFLVPDFSLLAFQSVVPSHGRPTLLAGKQGLPCEGAANCYGNQGDAVDHVPYTIASVWSWPGPARRRSAATPSTRLTPAAHNRL